MSVDTAQLIPPVVIHHSANPLPLWLHAAPLDCNCGYSWFPAAMIAALAVMALTIWWPVGYAGEAPADRHKDN